MFLFERYQTLLTSNNIVKRAIKCGKSYLNLCYAIKGEQVSYSIKLTSVPANIGKGQVWYFICPSTGKRCRKLYLIGKYFVHRKAYCKIYYDSQTRSSMDRMLYKFPKADKAQKLIDSKYFRKYYKGKPTKKYLRCLKEIEQANKTLKSLSFYIKTKLAKYSKSW